MVTGAGAGCVVRKEHRQHKHTNTTVREIGTNIIFHTFLEQVHELKPLIMCGVTAHNFGQLWTLPPPFVEIMEYNGSRCPHCTAYTTHYSVSQ